MKKKFWVVLLTLVSALCLCLGLAACGGGADGTYYLVKSDEYDKETYFILKGGKWTDEDGASGDYEISGEKIVFYTDLFGERVELTDGTLKNGILTLRTPVNEQVYAKEGAWKGASGGNQGGSQGGNQGGSQGGGGDSISTYSDEYVSFKPATQGWKSDELRQKYSRLIDKEVYVEITSDDLSGKPGTENNFTLRSVEGMTYSVGSDYQWMWYEDSGFSIANGAQRFSLGYGSNPQFVAVSKGNLVVQTYLVDIYVKYDYYISLYDRVNASEAYKKVRVIEGELFSVDFAPKTVSGFEFDCRVYYNSNTNKYEKFDASAPIRRDWSLYQRFKPIVFTPELDGGTLAGDISMLPFEPQQLSVPQKEGYDFLGWTINGRYLTNEHGATETRSITEADKQGTLTATWATMHFYRQESGNTISAVHVVPDISYTDGSGTDISNIKYLYGDIELTEQNSFEYGKEYSLPSITIRLNYLWDGWYDGETLLTKERTYTFTMGGSEFTYSGKSSLDKRFSVLEYTIESTECIVTGAKNTSIETLDIPDTVTKIAENAFKDYKNLKSVTIGSGVTSIGDSAFSGCSGLESITIPFVGGSKKTAKDTYQYPFGYIFGTTKFDGASAVKQFYYGSSTSKSTNDTYYIPDSLKSVTVTGGEILYGAFYSCSGLTSIVIPDSVTAIGKDAFCGCSGLTGQLKIPDSVTSIGEQAFYNCSRLTSATIGNGVTSIGYRAFYNCRGLTGELKIPDGVTSIGDGAFEGCSGLERITVAAENSNYSSQDGILYNKAKTEFILIPQAIKGAVTIPDGVTSIGDSAFYNCRGLTSVTFGSGVTSIGDSAFYNCRGLTSIVIPDSVTSIGSSAFYVCSGLESITVAAGNQKYHSAGNCLIETQSKTLVLGCKTSVIPKDGSVTSIGDYAFLGCSGLTGQLKIPDSVTAIGKDAFWYCRGLTGELKIPDGVTSIGDGAFEGCSGLERITVAAENSNYSSQDGILYNKAKTEFILIPQAIKGAVTIPDGVTSIGDSAFYNCRGLTSIVIPDSVTSIGNEAFRNCYGLTSVTFAVTEGWKVSKSSVMSNATKIQASDLQSPTTAAKYLRETYWDYYWKRG